MNPTMTPENLNGLIENVNEESSVDQSRISEDITSRLDPTLSTISELPSLSLLLS